VSESEKSETLEERVRRLESQKVHPEDELRKSPAEAEERMETAEEQAVPPTSPAGGG